MKKYLFCAGLCSGFFFLGTRAQTASGKPAAPPAGVKPAAQTATAKSGVPSTAPKPIPQPTVVNPIVQSNVIKQTSTPVIPQPVTTPGAVTPFLPAKIAGTVTLKTPVGVAGQANGIKTGIILVSVDTTIHSNPRNPLPDGKMAYLSIDFSNVTGTSQMEVASGKLMAWVFDKAGKQVPVTDQVLKSIRADMEGNTIADLIVKVPYRLKTDNNIYTIHFHWESPDKQKNIDILTSK